MNTPARSACVRAAVAKLPARWFAGLFVWRYYANIDDVSQEAILGFSPHAKESELLLENVFQTRWGADPEPWDFRH